MTKSNKYATAQEEFWASNFGEDYIERNNSKQLLASNINFGAVLDNAVILGWHDEKESFKLV